MLRPMAAGIKTMLSPWLPDYKQCYPHGYRIINNITTMATGLKEMIPPPHGCRNLNNVTPMMLPPWQPDYKQSYPHGCRIKNNVIPTATGL